MVLVQFMSISKRRKPERDIYQNSLKNPFSVTKDFVGYQTQFVEGYLPEKRRKDVTLRAYY